MSVVNYVGATNWWMKMYDREVFQFEKSQMMTSQNAVDCLLNFSKGPEAMLVTAVKKSMVYPVHEYNKSSDVLEISNCSKNHPIENQPTAYSINNSGNIQHKNTNHRGGQPRAICSFCGKHFTHLGDHNKHRRRHTGERPYGCDLCPQRFAHASNLARHRRLHSGEKPFQCNICGKRFTRKDKLAGHTARRCCSA